MNVETIIANAGRRNLTVRLKVETQKGLLEVFEVEAYGRKKNGVSLMIFCLDVKTFGYKNFDLALIRSAEMTYRMFKPRFPIDF